MSMTKKTNKGEEHTGAAFCDSIASRLPQYADKIDMVKPYVVMAFDAADASYPYLVQFVGYCQMVWEKLQPYDPQQFGPMIFGLVLCFFGGSYLTLVAAAEAVRLTVWDRMVDSLTVIYQQYQAAAEASRKDDEEDIDGDGVADVKQISKKDLVTRKVYLVMKTVNPDQASEAVGLFWGAMLSVIATLRVQFAQAVTLGLSIGNMLHGNFYQTIEPTVTDALPPELKKWGPTLTKYTFRSVGVTVAWFLQRIISGFHSAVRGGNLFVKNAILLAKKHGYLDKDFEEAGPRISGLGWAVSMIGFYWQLSNGFSLPFPLNLLLLPVTMLEWILQFWVGM